DFPGSAGNCANCHGPGAGVDGYLTTDMNAVRDQVTAGVHCDYCHKIGGVYMNPATDSVYPNVPGARGQRMLRPPEGEDIFFGPYDDVHDPDAHLPEISESRFCAPCHQFSFWGEPIYESYNEWLNSAYAEIGVTCQDCHMPPNGDEYFALPEMGGLAHPPGKIPSHRQRGASDTELMRDTLSMRLVTRWENGQLWARVEITNYNAGHHVPTDYPGRHLILTVEAVDKSGNPLALVSGSTVPEWGADLAGAPGKGFAKVLRDVLTGEKPVVSYWKQALIDEDNRIPANATDRSIYRFAADAGAVPITVRAELRFRRLFHALSEAKGWDKPEILMEEAELIVTERSETRAPLPDVTVNGSDGPLTVSADMAASIQVGLDVGDLSGQNADWWIWVDAGEEEYSYVHMEGWRQGVAACGQHPLVSISPSTTLFNGSLPRGAYTIHFAVDNNADGVRDATWSDSAKFYVK
ncbi:MAG: hypothetical protein GY859_11355, partial [Desulfobacterales bacterium]|nr:hypothetical protein [Desulfobacterales bacterium]